jgi:hypothetical protein
MTQSSDYQGSIIPQSQDELRDRFVSRNLREKLLARYACDVSDPFDLGFDDWKRVVVVRREEYRDRQTNQRVALIYWTKDEKRELIVSSLIDDGVRYKWNGVPATKDWSEYHYVLDV